MTTVSPVAANSREDAAPMPDAAPVIITTLDVSSMIFSLDPDHIITSLNEG
jgi:hypothetical protein